MHIELNFKEQQTGEWSISTFTQDGIQYQQLKKGDLLMMANTPKIIKDYTDFLQEATGNIHINGLGIGMCCQYLLAKSEVTQLTVVEYEKTIVDMVAPYFESDLRCNIIHGDAYTYSPPQGIIYDFVWHDIWTCRNAMNLKEMDVLFKKYAPFSKKQAAWSRAVCLELKERQEAVLLQY